MDPLTRKMVRVAGRSYEIQVLVTGHHFIAQVMDGPTAILEVRALRHVFQQGQPSAQDQDDIALLASRLADAAGNLLIQLLGGSDAAV